MARLSWLLARRFRRNRGGNGFLSFISVSSTLGITLGCSVLIAGLSMMNGFQQVLEERFLKLVPHIEFTAVNGAFNDWEELYQVSTAHPEVVRGQPVIKTQAMVQRGSEFHGMQVFGVAVDTDTAALPEPHAIRDYMTTESWQALEQTNRIVLGAGLAEKLGVTTGDELTVLVANDGGFQEPHRQRMVVGGTFRFGGELDYQQAYTSLATARKLTGYVDGVSTIQLAVRDIYQAQSLARQIGNQLSEHLYMDYWTRAQGHLYRDIQLVRLVMYLVLVLVMAVACFNIVSTLVMTVQEKQSQIAILKTMGMRNAAVMRLFIWQGLQTGIVGTVFGVLGGIALAYALPGIVSGVEQLSGQQVLSSDVYFVDSVPTQLLWLDVVLVAGVALVMSVIATLYPAWRAARTAPAHALHNH